MAQTPPPNPPSGDQASPAALEDMTLEEAVLAPLDAVFRAQVHAARSMVNFLLQIGYPPDEDGTAANPRNTAWMIKFRHEAVVDGRREEHVVEMPALALVPVTPLSVENASFEFNLAVSKVTNDYNQWQESSGKKDPPAWWLIKPRVVRGNITTPDPTDPKGAGQGDRREDARSMKVNIKVAKTPPPAGLEKLLTALTQIGGIASRQQLPSSPTPPEEPKKT